MMESTEMLLRFLRYTTGLPALCLDEGEDMPEKVEKAHCFSRQAQPLLTAHGLRTVMDHIQPATLYEIEDVLGVHLLIFAFQEHLILVGPYATDEWSDDRAENQLIGIGLPASYLLPYKLYYCSYALMEHHIVLHTVSGAVTALLPDSPPYFYRRVSGTLGQIEPELYKSEPLDFDEAVHRYELENQFFNAVKEGLTETALELWSRMGKAPQVEELSTPDIQNFISSATSLRTLTRKAAEWGGVHPAVVDAISVAYAQKMLASRGPEKLKAIIPDMIREFSEAVHRAKADQYSPAIGRAINYLRLHISQEIDTESLAKAAKCAPSYLGRRFKEETGTTVSQFVVRERCQVAASLLSRTDLPIRDISLHVGYADNSYFARVFKGCMGESPTMYRNKFRQ